jgi:hypothetical protein
LRVDIPDFVPYNSHALKVFYTIRTQLKRILAAAESGDAEHGWEVSPPEHPFIGGSRVIGRMRERRIRL